MPNISLDLLLVLSIEIEYRDIFEQNISGTIPFLYTVVNLVISAIQNPISIIWLHLVLFLDILLNQRLLYQLFVILAFEMF